MEAQAAATLIVGKAATRIQQLGKRKSGSSGKAEASRPATPTTILVKVQEASSTRPERHENVMLHGALQEVAIDNMMQGSRVFEKKISFSASTNFAALSTKQPAMAPTSKAPAMLGVPEDSSFYVSEPAFTLTGPRPSAEKTAPKAPPMMPRRTASASEDSRCRVSRLNSFPLAVLESGSGDSKIAIKGRKATSASTSGIEKRRRLSSLAGRNSFLSAYEGPSTLCFKDNGRIRPTSGRVMTKMESLVGLSKVQGEAPEREIKSLEENLAALRFAAIVTISPLRAKIIKLLRQYLEPEDHEMVARCVHHAFLRTMFPVIGILPGLMRGWIEEEDADCNIPTASRWMLSTARTEKDLAEVQWVLGLLAMFKRGETCPVSAEYEAVKGLEGLVGLLRRKQDQVRPCWRLRRCLYSRGFSVH